MGEKPWYVDVMVFAFMMCWLAFTWATIQDHGASPWLLGSAVAVAAVGITALYGTRTKYVRIGKFEWSGATDQANDTVELVREENR